VVSRAVEGARTRT